MSKQTQWSDEMESSGDNLDGASSPGRRNVNHIGASGAAEEDRDWKDEYIRLLADLDNTRKQLERSADQRIESKHDKLLKEILPVADNLERVLDQDVTDERCLRIHEGVAVILRDFLQALERNGVRPIHPYHERFDPNLHEARGVVYDENEDGTIVEVLQKGYMRENRLLRPAQVLVSAGADHHPKA
jgi:molecular chaperone GrpE